MSSREKILFFICRFLSRLFSDAHAYGAAAVCTASSACLHIFSDVLPGGFEHRPAPRAAQKQKAGLLLHRNKPAPCSVFFGRIIVLPALCQPTSARTGTIHRQRPAQTKISDSPDLDYGRAFAFRAVFLPSHGRPTMAAFRPRSRAAKRCLTLLTGCFGNPLIRTVPGE